MLVAVPETEVLSTLLLNAHFVPQITVHVGFNLAARSAGVSFILVFSMSAVAFTIQAKCGSRASVTCNRRRSAANNRSQWGRGHQFCWPSEFSQCEQWRGRA